MRLPYRGWTRLLIAPALGLLVACTPAGSDGPQNNNENQPGPDGSVDPTCGPDNCNGCCDDNGACQTGLGELVCGGGGTACQACAPDEWCDGDSCQVTAPACSPDNCNGCCVGDVCESGTDELACGSGGFMCEQCGLTETCEGGVCVEQCGPDNCSGCCDASGDCVDGTADGACGWGGLACAPCGLDEACSYGECIDVSCQATCAGCCSGDVCMGGTMDQACGSGGDSCASCGAGRTCTANACVVDPASIWDVHLYNADVDLLNANGDPWDAFGGLPDPYVTFTSGGVSEPETTAWSSVENNTITPLWDTVVLADVSAAELLDSFCYSVRDSDLNGDDEISSACVALQDADFDGSLRMVSLPGATVRFRLLLK